MKPLAVPVIGLVLFSAACSATGSALPPPATAAPASPGAASATSGVTATLAPTATPTLTATPTPVPDRTVAPAVLGQMRQRWSISDPGKPFDPMALACNGPACDVSSRIGAYAFSADASLLAVGACEGTLTANRKDRKTPYYHCDGASDVQLYRVADGSATDQVSTAGFPTSLAFDPAGQHLAIGMADSKIQIVDLSSSESTDVSHPAGYLGVTSLAFTPDGTMLVSEGNGKIVFWNWQTGSAVKTADGYGTMRFDPSGQKMVTAWYDSAASLKVVARVFDLSTPGRFVEIRARFVQPHMDNTAILADFIHDGADILLRGFNGAEWWDAQGSKFEGHTDLQPLFDARTNAFSPYGPVTADGMVVTQAGMVDAIPIPGLPAGLLSMGSGAPQTCGFAMWDPSTPGVLAAPASAGCRILLIAGDNRRAVLSPDNRYLAADDGAGNLRLWAFDPSADAVAPICVGTCAPQ